jgi:hypothetical protein
MISKCSENIQIYAEHKVKKIQKQESSELVAGHQVEEKCLSSK